MNDCTDLQDSAMIVINKPPGMSVQVNMRWYYEISSSSSSLSIILRIYQQGGVGIKYSLDTMAATSLKYSNPEPPRLVSAKHTENMKSIYV